MSSDPDRQRLALSSRPDRRRPVFLVARVAISVALALLLLRGRIWEPIEGLLRGGASAVWRMPLIWGLAVAALVALLGRSATARRWAAPPALRWTVLGGAALAGVALPLAVQVWVLDRVPHVQDSINYLWQARVFAMGRLWLPSHPLAEFFGFRFMVNDGRWYSLFQPGWPALLAIGELLHAPWAVGPALGGLLVLVTWGLGRETVGRRPALLGAVLLVASPWFVFQQASLMAHGAAALLAVSALWAYVVAQRRQSPLLSGMSGLLLGALFCTRALDAAVLFLPLGAHAALRLLAAWRAAPAGARLLGGRRALAGLCALVVGSLLAGSLQFAYNRALTGSWGTWPQDRYFELTEPDGACHRLGFGQGVGCPREHGPDLGPEGFTPWRAVRVTATRLRSLGKDLWGLGLGLALLAWGLAGVGRRRWPLAAAVAGPIAGYFFYYYHGNCFGARYYYTALPAVALLVAWVLSLLAGLDSDVRDHGGPPPSAAADGPGPQLTLGRLRRPLAYGIVAALLAGGLLNELPLRWSQSGRGYWGVHAGLRRIIEREQLRDAVVLIPPSRHGPDLDDRDYRIGFAHARPQVDASAVVIARDQGIANPQLRAYFPERTFYRYRPWRGPDGALVPAGSGSGAPLWLLRSDAEGKFPPVWRRDGWASVRRFVPELGPAAGRGHVLRFQPTGPAPAFDLPQHVQQAGDYEIVLWLVRGPSHGDVRVALDGRPLEPLFSGYGNRERLVRWAASRPVALSPGRHILRLEVVGSSPAAGGRVVEVDRISFAGAAPPGS